MRYLIVATLALVMLIGVACGGGDDDDDASGGGGGDAPASQNGGSSSGGSGGGSGDGGGSDGGGSDDNGRSDDGDSSADFSGLFGLFGQQDYRVTFTIETSTAGETFSGEWTWYRDVEGDRSRFDIDTAAGSEVVTAIYITTSEMTLFCSEGSCLAFPTGGSSPFPDPSVALTNQISDIDDQVLGGSVQDAGTRTIAGIEARCFTFDAPGDGIEEGESCVTAEGVPVLSVWEGSGGSFRIEATDYSNQVSDDDFEAPFPVMQLPG